MGSRVFGAAVKGRVDAGKRVHGRVEHESAGKGSGVDLGAGRGRELAVDGVWAESALR